MAGIEMGATNINIQLASLQAQSVPEVAERSNEVFQLWQEVKS